MTTESERDREATIGFMYSVTCNPVYSQKVDLYWNPFPLVCLTPRMTETPWSDWSRGYP